MPKYGISIKIDVKKIDKARLFKGEKGTYLNLTTFVDTGTQDEYGNNGFISQETTKDERSDGVQTPILGNVKVFYNDGESNKALREGNSHAPQQTSGVTEEGFNDDIPF